MKYLLIVWVLLGAMLAYLRYEKPADWNRFLDTMKVPGVSPVAENAAASPGERSPVDDDTLSPPPSRPASPELISPSSTNFINPDHVKTVVQPGQETNPPPTSPAGATNDSGTPSPATPRAL
jgi:hypothetical protein